MDESAPLNVIFCFACLSTARSSRAHIPQWPRGTYGLPMAMSGCPGSDGFDWKTGRRYEDLEDSPNSDTKSSPGSHFKSWVTEGDALRYFCMKRNDSFAVDMNRTLWPRGNYCIYKSGKFCPSGFTEGWVLWDDENGFKGQKNRNYKVGTLPSGKYNQDTKIFFCCQNAGRVSTPIHLPTTRPFYLIAFKYLACQDVYRAFSKLENITYDTEDDNNQNKQGIPFPIGANLANPTIHYCYYRGTCRSFCKNT